MALRGRTKPTLQYQPKPYTNHYYINLKSVTPYMLISTGKAPASIGPSRRTCPSLCRTCACSGARPAAVGGSGARQSSSRRRRAGGAEATGQGPRESHEEVSDVVWVAADSPEPGDYEFRATIGRERLEVPHRGMIGVASEGVLLGVSPRKMMNPRVFRQKIATAPRWEVRWDGRLGTEPAGSKQRGPRPNLRKPT